MFKIVFLSLFFTNFLFSYTFRNEDLEVFKELNINPAYAEEEVFKSVFNEYSSNYNISYYDNIFRKSAFNMKIVRDEIEYENLPSGIFFVPLLESGFSNESRGKNSPSGLWQIIPETGRSLRLRVDESIDERLDLVKSTDAATSYMVKYYKKLNKWYLAVLAYNCGEGRVIEAVNRSMIDKFLDENPDRTNDFTISNYKQILENSRKNKIGMNELYQINSILLKKGMNFSFEYLARNNKEKGYVPQSSLEYINKIIAFSILSNRDSYRSIDKKSKFEIEKVKAPKALQLKSIASAISMDYNQLKNLNKHIKNEVLPSDSKSYNLYIPKDKLELYNERIFNVKPVILKEDNKTDDKKNNKTKVENSKKIDDNKPVIYVVKKGDTLDGIAKKLKVNIKKLKLIDSKKSKTINIGDRIEIQK